MGDDPTVLECCCNVLMVSNGARISLEHPAAKALARLFLTPLSHAASGFNTGTAVFERAILSTGLIVEISGRWRRGRGRNDVLLELVPGSNTRHAATNVHTNLQRRLRSGVRFTLQRFSFVPKAVLLSCCKMKSDDRQE